MMLNNNYSHNGKIIIFPCQFATFCVLDTECALDDKQNDTNEISGVYSMRKVFDDDDGQRKMTKSTTNVPEQQKNGSTIFYPKTKRTTEKCSNDREEKRPWRCC